MSQVHNRPHRSNALWRPAEIVVQAPADVLRALEVFESEPAATGEGDSGIHPDPNPLTMFVSEGNSAGSLEVSGVVPAVTPYDELAVTPYDELVARMRDIDPPSPGIPRYVDIPDPIQTHTQPATALGSGPKRLAGVAIGIVLAAAIGFGFWTIDRPPTRTSVAATLPSARPVEAPALTGTTVPSGHTRSPAPPRTVPSVPSSAGPAASAGVARPAPPTERRRENATLPPADAPLPALDVTSPTTAVTPPPAVPAAALVNDAPIALPPPARSVAPPATQPPAMVMNPPISAPTPRPDTGEIQAVLGRYRTAFSVLDSAAATAIWPTVDSKALGRAFARLEEQTFNSTTARSPSRACRRSRPVTAVRDMFPRSATRPHASRPGGGDSRSARRIRPG